MRRPSGEYNFTPFLRGTNEPILSCFSSLLQMTHFNFVVDGFFFVYCMHFQLSKEKIKKCSGGAVWTCQMTGIDVDWAQEPGWGGVG